MLWIETLKKKKKTLWWFMVVTYNTDNGCKFIFLVKAVFFWANLKALGCGGTHTSINSVNNCFAVPFSPRKTLNFYAFFNSFFLSFFLSLFCSTLKNTQSFNSHAWEKAPTVGTNHIKIIYMRQKNTYVQSHILPTKISEFWGCQLRLAYLIWIFGWSNPIWDLKFWTHSYGWRVI